MSFRRSRGFTLVELLMALSILALAFSIWLRWKSVQAHREAILTEQRQVRSCIHQFLRLYRSSLPNEDWAGIWYAGRTSAHSGYRITRSEPPLWDFKLEIEVCGDGYCVHFWGKIQQKCLWTEWVYGRTARGAEAAEGDG